MDFLRPHVVADEIAAKRTRYDSENTDEGIVVVSTTTATPNPIRRQPLVSYWSMKSLSCPLFNCNFFQSVLGQQEKRSIVVGDSANNSVYEMVTEEETVEPIGTTFRIYFEYNDDTENQIESSAANANNLSGASHDDDDDVDAPFLALIGRELRAMTPSTRRKFKRNVTQLLYS